MRAYEAGDGTYTQPVFNLLEGRLTVVLANAQHIKAVPGRKTDVRDCDWPAELLAHGLIRASFISPAGIRALRDLTRHRKSLLRDRREDDESQAPGDGQYQSGDRGQ